MISGKNESLLPERPKRPLSAYNLFYRYKRNLVLKANSEGHNDKDTISRLLTTPPGLEEYPRNSTSQLPPKTVQKIRRENIRSALANCMEPAETKNRVHKKTHGLMNFMEMSRLMCDGWKHADEVTKEIFKELSEEAREGYRTKMADYKARILMSNKNLQMQQHLQGQNTEQLKNVSHLFPGCLQGLNQAEGGNTQEEFKLPHDLPGEILDEYKQFIKAQQMQQSRQCQITSQMQRVHEIQRVFKFHELQRLRKMQELQISRLSQDERRQFAFFHDLKSGNVEQAVSHSDCSAGRKGAMSMSLTNSNKSSFRTNDSYVADEASSAAHDRIPTIFCKPIGSSDIRVMNQRRSIVENDTFYPGRRPPSQSSNPGFIQPPSRDSCFIGDIRETSNQKTGTKLDVRDVSASDMLQLISHLGGESEPLGQF